jgi:hypothetical protein
MFVGVFIVAWQLAVRVTERYLITPAQPEKPSTRSEAKSREQNAAAPVSVSR